MPLTSLSSAQLHQLLRLVQEKEKIQSKLAKIDRSLKALENGTPPKKIGAISGASRRSRRRVGPKDAILEELQTAGQEGMTVKDLARSIGVKPGSVSVWLYTTGKKVKGLRKVGKGRFRYSP